MTNISFIIVLLIFLSSCTYTRMDQDAQEYLVIYDKIENQYIKDMQRKYGASIFGSGGSMMYNIKSVSLSFNLVGEVGIEQARELYVKFVSEFLDRINTDSAIQPYLDHKPFTENDFNLHLIFFTKPSVRPSTKYVGIVSMFKGNIEYDVYDPKFENYRNIHVEPYQDAVKIIKQQKMS